MYQTAQIRELSLYNDLCTVCILTLLMGQEPEIS